MICCSLLPRSAHACRAPRITSRCLSTASLDRLSRPVQAYISAARDPYLNLSIEHHILQTADPDSTILFLYVNRPSIIIGRNQNPWLEVNLALLNPSVAGQADSDPGSLGTVDLVRRRSGGGTVFHDEGNVNWTVISPAAHFTRDKHAEMVVRALRRCGVERARVNPRHDIVLDQGERRHDSDPTDTHVTPYQLPDSHPRRPLKVSGSAYKLTRKRALHHGTCLLSSPNLNLIPHYLHSPAKPFIAARGVESVSSPVSNLLLDNEEFMTAVQTEFAHLYHDSRAEHVVEVDDTWLEDESVRKGYEELKSLDWKFLQTPQFSIVTPPGAIRDLALELTVRYGSVTSGSISLENTNHASSHRIDLAESLVGRKLHQIRDWNHALDSTLPSLQKQQVVDWLGRMLPRV